MTEGLEVLVQEVIAAITTAPWSTSVLVPSARVTSTGLCGRSPLALCAGEAEAGKDSSTDSSTTSSTYSRTSSRQVCWARESAMRSCGRLGPAIDGTTSARSSSRYSENSGSLDGSCQKPLALA